MTDDRMALVDLLQKSGDGDFLRSVAEAVLQILMEADVEGLIGAGRHERSAERLNYRNGYRERSLDTRLGSLQLLNPHPAPGALFPAVSRPPHAPRDDAGYGGPGGLDRRRLDPARRRAGAGDGPQRHLEEPSLQAVQGHRRAGQRLPGATNRGRMAISVARCYLPQGA